MENNGPDIIDNKETMDESNDNPDMVTGNGNEKNTATGIDPVTEQTKYDINDKSKETTLCLPSALPTNITSLLEAINENNNNSVLKDYVKKGGSVPIGFNMNSIDYSLTEDMLAPNLKDGEWSNNVKYGSKDINILPLAIKSNGKVLNGDAAIARLASAMGVGETTQVPLWHSGFWVTLRPPKDVDIINLEILLSNNQIELGRDTNSLVFSNYSVVFNRILSDFILKHIENTTLDMSPTDDIRNYIKIQDYPLLVLGLLHGMHPNGYPLSRTCTNSTKTDENGVPKCSYVMKGKVNFRKMSWVNRKMLTEDKIKHMSSRTPKSISMKDMENYQNTLYINKEVTKTYHLDNGVKIDISLNTPMLMEHIDSGELWINNIVKNSEKVFTDGSSETEKNNIINSTANALIVGIYSGYITRIVVNDDSDISGSDGIDSSMGFLSSDPKLLTDIINDIKTYINNNTMAIVGLPNYECPECMKIQNEENSHTDFKEIIPINAVESFFSLGALKAQEAVQRHIS